MVTEGLSAVRSNTCTSLLEVYGTHSVDAGGAEEDGVGSNRDGDGDGNGDGDGDGDGASNIEVFEVLQAKIVTAPGLLVDPAGHAICSLP